MYEEYLLSHHKEELVRLLTGASEDCIHLPLNINFVKLFENDPTLGSLVLKDPDKVFDKLDEALIDVQKILSKELNSEEILDKCVHTRIYGLPSCHDQNRNSIPRSIDLHLFLQLTGSIVRTTLVKILEFRRNYKCSKCKYEMTVSGVYEEKYIILPPKTCTNPEGCNGTNIIPINSLNVQNCKDYQEVKLQELVSESTIGNIPSFIWITLEDDLVDVCKPGDNVTVSGIVKRRWKPLAISRKIDTQLVFKANHLQINNAQCCNVLITQELKDYFHAFWRKYRNLPLVGRDIILNSISPQLYGLYTIKLATALVLASGSRLVESDRDTGVRARSEAHLLLVGDPGTGKSQILKFASKIVPRSVLTTGVGSTSAGLTVTAIQEGGEWMLEGGALVLADGGICCIDEFNSMKEHDRTSIHEAMEQQTISVAKASIVCKLNTKCSILAATNPKGQFDPGQPLTVNVALPSPLLSRFDIILLLQDSVDFEWDEIVCDHTLSRMKICEKNDEKECDWEIDRLKAYFSYIKNIQPNLTPQANRILSSYYQLQRRSFMKNRVTVRLLDSLVRLSQSHARLMFHDNVHIMDAVMAVIMMENSMHGAILNINVNTLHSPFPKVPMTSYEQLARAILEKLELLDILREELIYLNELNDVTKCRGEEEEKSFGNIKEDNSSVETFFGSKIIQVEKVNRTIKSSHIESDYNPFESIRVESDEKKIDEKKNEIIEKENKVEYVSPLKKFKFKGKKSPQIESSKDEENNAILPCNVEKNNVISPPTDENEVPEKKSTIITINNKTSMFVKRDDGNKTELKESKINENLPINVEDVEIATTDKRKRINDNVIAKTQKKSKTSLKHFDPDNIDFNIETDIDWNFGASSGNEEKPSCSSNTQSFQNCTKSIFETEDDIDFDF